MRAHPRSAATLLALLLVSFPPAGAVQDPPAEPPEGTSAENGPAAAATDSGDGESDDLAALRETLRQTERAFAAAAGAKDLDRFASFIAEGAVFFGGAAPLRGRSTILSGWAGLFTPEGPTLRWEPCAVEIEADGWIGSTTGPYWIEAPARPADGTVPQGTFFSVWHRLEDGSWEIVLDTGTPPVPGPPVEKPCSGDG